MGGQATQPQPLPIPVPPFGAPGAGAPAPAPAPAGGIKGGSLAGIPDLQTLFNSAGQVFPNSLSFPKSGAGVFGGAAAGPVSGAPAAPAAQSPLARLMQVFAGVGGGERELRRPDIMAAQDVQRRLREGRAAGTGIPSESERAAAEAEGFGG